MAWVAQKPAPLEDLGSTCDAWLAVECAVSHSSCEEGHVLSHIPGLLAAALERHVEAAAVAAAVAAALETADCPPYFRRCRSGGGGQLTRLHGMHTPQIGLQAYAQRLLRYCKCSPVCFVAAYCYVLRLEGSGRLRVDALCAHRLFIAGTVLAAKFFDDRHYANSHYAQVGGVCTTEFNAMEMELLQVLDYRVRVDVRELCQGLQHMHAQAAQPRGCLALPAAAGDAPPGPGCCSEGEGEEPETDEEMGVCAWRAALGTPALRTAGSNAEGDAEEEEDEAEEEHGEEGASAFAAELAPPAAATWRSLLPAWPGSSAATAEAAAAEAAAGVAAERVGSRRCSAGLEGEEPHVLHHHPYHHHTLHAAA